MSAAVESRVPGDWAPETCLRLYDEAMIKLLQGLTLRGAAPTVKSGWGSRYFEEVSEIHDKDNLKAKQAIPLPIVVLSTMGISPDHTRWTRNDIRVTKGGPLSAANVIYHGNDRKAVLNLPAPQPIDIGYQIDIRTKTQQDMRFLVTGFLALYRWSPVEIFLTIDFPDPWGRKLIPLRFERSDNTSNLEAGEHDRELRETISVTLKGWIFKAPIVRKTIQNVHIAIIDGDPNDPALVAHYSDPAQYNFNGDLTILESVTESGDYSPPDRVLATLSYADGALTAIDGTPV